MYRERRGYLSRLVGFLAINLFVSLTGGALIFFYFLNKPVEEAFLLLPSTATNRALHALLGQLSILIGNLDVIVIQLHNQLIGEHLVLTLKDTIIVEISTW